MKLKLIIAENLTDKIHMDAYEFEGWRSQNSGATFINFQHFQIISGFKTYEYESYKLCKSFRKGYCTKRDLQLGEPYELLKPYKRRFIPIFLEGRHEDGNFNCKLSC